MRKINRRRFVEYLAAGTAAVSACGLAATGSRARAQAVIVGGGPAGAAAALALRQVHPDNPVVLVERDPRRLGRAVAAPFDRPGPGPDLGALRRAGVEVLLDDVTGLDWANGRVRLFSGRAIAFDRLILAPGTAAMEEDIPGLDPVARHLWPAAWGSTREARRLAARLGALPAAGHVVLRLPRVCSHPGAALARAVRLAGTLNAMRPESRLTILDGSATTELAERFEREIAERRLRIAAGWRTAANGGTVLRVDASRGHLETTAGCVRADVVNFVGLQGAGGIARDAGLVDVSGWCPTDAHGRSAQRPEAIILGDARKGARRTVADSVLFAEAAASALPSV
ncbi:Pyridine nucleotide-disulphide oxidoreductase [Rhodovulum sp. ES.010]|uniref:FAD-dependent oxidoreductase n=1 Tax=Rhodovulum sp. ES.010 TaxID=1882821 RepID=UPI000929D388|nr:FAD-dependent oxidoreductase [Rhodovulum sp. ES.010]SIO53827.1 Pyridine nucleotide-disulphide oxidoreductase [Rhodovulum sp. ES.010]